MGAGIGRDSVYPVEVRVIKDTPPKLPLQDREDNIVYLLKKAFEVPGQFGHSEIVAISTKKDMIFSMANILARQEYAKPQELGKWDYIIFMYDNESGKFLDKVDISKYRPQG